MLDEFRRLALFTSGVAELTRNRAEQLVREMVKSGEVRRDQASSLVKNAMEFSRENRKELGALIRSEIRNQVAALGLATARDVQRLERRVARLENRSQGPSTQASRTKKTTAKKTTSKKSTRKRTTGARMSPPPSS